ncbi:hypothetical protein M1843_18135 [Isoptericola sp. 4D.3]|uniref:Uncharacterized protein n=1 Tax=Isoptericola peretonis TaxID=2918523 RepID=A0ABT0J841_9MICO|nr:hypothetical protein [Isoptericola sp. 4D.3]
MTTAADHDAYIAAAPEPFRPSLRRLRKLLAGTLREAEEIAGAGLQATTTGITFSPRTPVPDDLVERLALASRRDAGA